MGCWGAGISGNDTAMDLRSEYQAAFYYFDVETALQKIDAYIRSEWFDETDEEEWCNYYYSLADFMWKKGILTEAVKTRALEMIDAGFGMDGWEMAGKAALKERRKVLEKFRKQLCSEQPAKKKIRIQLYMKPIFSLGEVIAFQLQTLNKTYLAGKNFRGERVSHFDENFFRACHGKWVVVRKAFDLVSYHSDIVPEVQDIYPVFKMYSTIFDECPTMEELKNVPLVSTVPEKGEDLIQTDGSLLQFKKRNYRVLGSVAEKADMPDKTGWFQRDCIYLGLSHDSYNADTEIINAIVDGGKRHS